MDTAAPGVCRYCPFVLGSWSSSCLNYMGKKERRKESPSSLGSWQEESEPRYGARRRFATPLGPSQLGEQHSVREASEQEMVLAQMSLLLA